MVAERRPWRRVSRRERCPICDDHDSTCLMFDDGDVLCAHVTSDEPCEEGTFLGIGWWHRARNTDRPLSWSLRTPAPAATRPVLADLTTCDAIYTAFFPLCPLSDAHRAQHALSDAQARRYGTVPRDLAARRRIIEELLHTFTRDQLLSVPGFVERNGHIEIRMAGMILPCHDLYGRIVAVDVRRDAPKPSESKYYKASSRTATAPDAPGPGTPAHLALPVAGVRIVHEIGITEGIKKGDAAADALGFPVIAAAGIGCTSDVITVLRQIADERPDVTVVTLMLDRDDPHKNDGRTVADVERAGKKIAAAAVEYGFGVRYAVWDHCDGKGIDDLLAAGKGFTLERYRPASGLSPTLDAAGADETPSSSGNKPAMAETIRVQQDALQRAYAKIDVLMHAITVLVRLLLTEQYTESEKKMLVWTLQEKHGYSFGLPIPETFATVRITDADKPQAGLSVNSFDTARKRFVADGVLIVEKRPPLEGSPTGRPFDVITVDGERLERLIVGLNADPCAQTNERQARAAQRVEEARTRYAATQKARERRDEQDRITRQQLASIGGERRHFAEVTEMLSHQLTEKEAEAEAMRHAAVDAQQEVQRIIAQARRDSIPCGGCGSLIAIEDWRCDDCRAKGTDTDRFAAGEFSPTFGGKGYDNGESSHGTVSHHSPSTSPLPPKVGENSPGGPLGEDLRPCAGGCGTATPHGWECKPCRGRPVESLHIPEGSAATAQGVHS